MTHIVTMYNNKGGVSKTTTVFNLGAVLAEHHKVLLVDCDPQCNATELFLASTDVLDDRESFGTDRVVPRRPRRGASEESDNLMPHRSTRL